MRLPAFAICAASFFIAGCQAPAPQGEGQKVFVEAIEILKTRPMGRERVDWNSVRKQLQAEIPKDANSSQAYPVIQKAVAKLNDYHARFTPPPSLAPAPPPPPPPPPATANPAAAPTPVSTPRTVPTVPFGVMIKGNIAFITVPMCTSADVQGLRAFATTLRSEVMRLNEQQPVAWIIDLRFNGGGNIWPMLIGLQPLLGDGVRTTSIDSDGNVARVTCDGGAVWLDQGSGPVEQLRIEPAIYPQIVNEKIAVLIGSWTMSSGELLALAFRGHARFFGEPSAGLTTVTDYFPLSDGSILNLPISQMADRNGWSPRGAIVPDVHIQSGDWPTDSDDQVKAAVHWALDRVRTSPSR